MPQSFTVNGAPLELLDVGELALIHSNYKPMDTWLIDKLFPNRPSFDRDEVPLAELNTVHDLAPLVAPHQPGKPFDTKRAAKVDFVVPAYYKPKNMVTPATAFDEALLERLRAAGVISTGSQQLSDQEKMMIAQIAVMKRNHDAIDNSVLLMATELLLNGKYVLQSADYEANEVNYERDASLHFTPATPWNQAGAKPVTDIEAMEKLLLDANGGASKMYLMSGKVWAALSTNEEFKERFVKPYAGIAVSYKPSLNVQEGSSFKGYLDEKELWVYDGTYRLSSGVKRFIPDDYFGAISDTQGSIAQCKIKNMLANGAVTKYFDRQWYSEDPSGIYLMTESAPLAVPSNKNGVCGGKGFIA